MTITDSTCYQASSGTSLTGTVTAAAGDIVLATVSTRSATTLPSGWTQLYYSDIFDSSTGQRMYMIYKQVDSAGSVSCQVTQTSSGRMYINLIAVAGYTSVAYYAANIATGTSISAPDKTAGDAVIWGCSCAYWITSAPYGDWATSPADLTLVSLDDASYQPRNGNFIDDGSGAATDRTFIPSLGTAYPICIAAVRFYMGYEASGHAIYASTDVQAVTDYASSVIAWTSSMPENTTISVSAVCAASTPDDEDYQDCTNGLEIPGLTVGDDLSGQTLYIKIDLTTTDDTVTPSLSALGIVVKDATDETAIVLTMQTLKRFRNVEGDLTVTYDATVGNLAGEGGPVLSFSKTFSPVDLIQKPNPHDPENIDMSVSAVGTLTRIYYTNAKEEEAIEITISATGTLTHIDDI